MGNQVYSQAGYIIIRVGNGYVVINKRKKFSEGHTHLKSFKTAKYLIQLASRHALPHHLSGYLLVSLMRISEDELYQRKIGNLLEQKRNKKERTVRIKIA